MSTEHKHLTARELVCRLEEAIKKHGNNLEVVLYQGDGAYHRFSITDIDVEEVENEPGRQYFPPQFVFQDPDATDTEW